MDEQSVVEQSTPAALPEEPSSNSKKKVNIGLMIRIFVLAFLAVTVLSLVSVLIGRATTGRPPVMAPEENPKQPPVEEEPKEDWKNYKNDTYKFTFDYPAAGTLEEPADEKAEVKIYKTLVFGERQKDPVTADDTLVDGYIFKVSVTPGVTSPKLNELAAGKLLYFNQICPGTYSASEITDTVVDTIAGKTFSVKNCVVDYEINFVDYSGSIYELTLVYRGDFGYKQKYVQDAHEILDKFHFLDKPIVKNEGEDYILFKAYDYRFQFVYPKKLKSCCVVPGPVYDENLLVTILADKEVYDTSKGKSFDGVGVYIHRKEEGEKFDGYLELQKKTLQDDYKIIKGYGNPGATQEEVMLGDIKGTLLHGYAWWGDMVYADVPNDNYYLIISMVEERPGGYGEEFNKILGSFEFGSIKE